MTPETFAANIGELERNLEAIELILKKAAANEQRLLAALHEIAGLPSERTDEAAQIANQALAAHV